MTGIRIATSLWALGLVASPLLAQGACELETRKPYQLASAVLYLQKHDAQVDESERAKRLKEAVKVLTDRPERIKNEAGRNFLLGGVYVRWFQDQGARPKVRATRGDLGFSENAEGEFFLPTAVDEAMSIVEREMPACADSTLRYRNAIFAKVLNTAIAYYNAKQYDPAIEYARYALQVSPRSAQVGNAYQVLANASQSKGDLAGAVASLEKAIAGMGTDAAGAPARAAAMFNLAVLTRDLGVTKEGAERSALLRRSAELFKGVAELAPDGPNAATSRAAYARTLQEAGDSVAVANVYADMIANPAKYTALQLFEAGVVLANGKKLEDAATLYEAGLAMNPHYRDALFNAANVYFGLRLPEKMAPLVDRLRAIDPMNPDVVKLAGAVWQERGRQATDAKAKKTAQDSTITYIERAGKLPARVQVNQFTVGRDGKATITGSMENLGAAAASYTVLFELVDKTGAGVGSGTAVIEAVPPKASKDFTLQIAGASPVGWRYTMR
ncbi:MAG: tetratricopeptide repeat protein [Gemmatimonadetes bacterium]|nr:tetratricopeptide repeat protein [Gemmatimonadota bacterium]